jgi:hypothetical protein
LSCELAGAFPVRFPTLPVLGSPLAVWAGQIKFEVGGSEDWIDLVGAAETDDGAVDGRVAQRPSNSRPSNSRPRDNHRPSSCICGGICLLPGQRGSRQPADAGSHVSPDGRVESPHDHHHGPVGEMRWDTP